MLLLFYYFPFYGTQSIVLRPSTCGVRIKGREAKLLQRKNRALWGLQSRYQEGDELNKLLPVFHYIDIFLTVVRRKEAWLFSATCDFGPMTLGIDNLSLVLN